MTEGSFSLGYTVICLNVREGLVKNYFKIVFCIIFERSLWSKEDRLIFDYRSQTTFQ